MVLDEAITGSREALPVLDGICDVTNDKVDTKDPDPASADRKERWVGKRSCGPSVI